MSAVLQDRFILDRRSHREADEKRPRVRVKSRRRTATWREVLRFAAIVSLFACFLHFLAGFTAQLLIEQARRSAIRSNTLALKAEQEAAALRIELDRVQASDRIDSWASLNGFRPSYLASNEAEAR